MAEKTVSATPGRIPETEHPLSDDLGRDCQTLVVSEVQLLLAEKRTSLAALRTGIAVFVLPLSVLSVLIATSRYYDFIHVLHFIIPLLSLSAALVLLASYLVIRAIIKMRRQDKLIMEIKKKHPLIAPFID